LKRALISLALIVAMAFAGSPAYAAPAASAEFVSISAGLDLPANITWED